MKGKFFKYGIILSLTLALALGLALALPALAKVDGPTTHYVATTGSDTYGDGSAIWADNDTSGDWSEGDAGPWATIQHAIGEASSGDIINVAAGTYGENPVLNEAVTLLGAQHDVDPAGSTGRGGGESIITGQVEITAGATFNGFKLDGNRVYVHGADGATVSYNIFTNSSMHGVNIDASSPNTQVLYNTVSSPAWEGIVNWGSDGVVISHNYVTGVDTQQPIECNGHTGTGIQITYNTITGCTNNKGINYWGGPGPVISHNTITGTSYEAIFSDTYANTIGDNIISNIDGAPGIKLYPCGVPSAGDKSTISNNQISNTKWEGISVMGQAYTQITGNNLTNCNNYGSDGTGDWDYAGIHVQDEGGFTSDQCVINGNTVTDGINGIQTWSSNCTITNNTVTNMGLSYADSKDTYWNSGIIIGGMPAIGVSPAGTIVEENILTGNVVGLYVHAGVPGVAVVGTNNFTNNGTQLVDDSGNLNMGAALAGNIFDRAVTVDHEGASLLHTIWSSIQDGIDSAVANDTVKVGPGEYAGAVVDESIKLVGDAGGASVITSGVPYKAGNPAHLTAFRPEADGSEIRNFTIDCGENPDLGIYAMGVDNIIVDSLTINSDGTVQGISNWGGSGWVITNNVITNTVASGGGGIGIFLGARPQNDYYVSPLPVCSNNLVQYNQIHATATAETYSCPGIFLGLDLRYGGYDYLNSSEDVSGNQILNNIITSTGVNNGVGIEVGTILGNNEADPDRTDQNKIDALMAAAALHDNTVRGNNINGAYDGIYIYNVTDLTLDQNIISNSVDTGIYVEYAQSGTTVTQNTFTSNGVQVQDDTGTLNIGDILANNGNTFDRAVTIERPGDSLLSTIWSSIQDAIDTAIANDTVNVAAGMYTESIDINTVLTLQGAGSTTTTIVGTGTTAVTISADNVTFTGFTVTNPDGKHGIYAADHSNLTITDNSVSNVGIWDATTTGTNFGIGIVSSSAAVDTINITENIIARIFGDNGKSAGGICIGWSNGASDITNLLIQDNAILDITSDDTVPYSAGGRGAYGILINHTTGGDTGQTISPQILDNDIYNLSGLWSHGIGLEGKTPGALVQGNTITNLTSTKQALEAPPNNWDDAVGVMVEDNPNAGTVQIHQNSFTGLAYGVYRTASSTGTVNAENNWWGSANGPAHAGNTYNVGFQGSAASDNVDYVPWYDTDINGASFAPIWNGFNGYSSIQAAVDGSSAGDTINVLGAGTYTETVVPPYHSLNLVGAGMDAVIWNGNGGMCIDWLGPGADIPVVTPLRYEITGFTFFTDMGDVNGGMIKFAKANRYQNTGFGLDFHHNRLITPGESNYGLWLCRNSGIVRDPDTGESPVTIHDNIFETTSGICMSNSDNYDVYNNDFTYDVVGNGYATRKNAAIFIGSGCTTEQPSRGGHRIWNNDFAHVGDGYDGSEASYPRGAIAIEHYSGQTGLTLLPNTIENNTFNNPNGTGITYECGDDVTYPSDTVRQNSFASNLFGIRVYGDFADNMRVDAINNWWGSASGPTHEGNTYTNPAGDPQGDVVSDNVDYVPWYDTDMNGASFAPVSLDGTAGYSSIQAAIDAATSTVITCAPGTYDEQVVIDKDLTLQGAGDTTVIQPSQATADNFQLFPRGTNASDLNSAPIVTAITSGGTVNVQNLMIDGSLVTTVPGGASMFAGIMYRDTNGLIDQVTVQNIGAIYGGLGIYLTGFDSAVGVEVSNCNITGYNKNGITANNPMIDANIHDNTVAGMGPTDATAQNGIQIGYGATGTVNDNNVSGHVWTGTYGGSNDPATDPEADGAAGILLYQSSGTVEVAGNTLTGNQFGIWAVGAADINAHDNIITGLAHTGNAYPTGIAIQDSDQWSEGGEVGTTGAITGNAFTNHDYGVLLLDYTAGEPLPDVPVNGNNFANNGVQLVDTAGTLDMEATLAGNTFDRAVTIDRPLSSLLHTIWSGIQDGIDNAITGDTVNVGAGTYTEAIVVDKPLTLRGATWDVNKNGYPVPPGYAWDTNVESIIQHPNPGSGYIAIVDIYDTSDVTFEGFVVQELNAVASTDSSLVRVRAQTQEVSNVIVRNNIIGPFTNTTAQDGNQGRMGLYLVNNPYSDQFGIVDSTFSGNKIFDCQGNGNNVFLWSSYNNYGAAGPASMAGTVIEDNEISGAHRSGIETAGGFSDLTIRNNSIFGNYKLPGDTPDLKYGNGILMIRGSGDRDNVNGYGPVDVTLEGNDIHDNAGHGVYMGPNNDGVTLNGNDIYNNGQSGLIVDLIGNYWNPDFEANPGPHTNLAGSQGIRSQFNNIYGNGEYGIRVIGEPTNGFEMKATNNWWNTKTGPTHADNPDGTGDPVSDYVNYDPWIGAGVSGAQSQTTGAGEATVNAQNTAQTIVEKSGNGTPTVTVAKYEDNPGTGFTGDTGSYIDVHVDDTTDVDEIVIKVYYTNADIAGLDENSLKLRWWNGTEWVTCSDTGVNTTDTNGYSGYMWAKIRNDTVPSLADLVGTAFGGGGTALPGGGGGGGGGGAPPVLPPGTTNVSGYANMEGRFITTAIAASDDEMCKVIIDKGTVGLDANLLPLTQIVIVPVDDPPAPPTGMNIIALAYDIGPDGASFDPPATLTWTYNPADLPEGVEETALVLAYYDEATGTWILLETTVNPAGNIATAPLGHFTTFALFGRPEPAAFTVSALSISPAEVTPDETVNISVLVTNYGGSTGSYSAILRIDGVSEVQKGITLAAGESRRLIFTVTRSDNGIYNVTLAGFSGTFKVASLVTPPPTTEPPAVPAEPSPPTETTPPGETPTVPAATTPAATTPAATAPVVEEAPVNWGMIGGIIGGAAVVIILLVVLMWTRRRD